MTSSVDLKCHMLIDDAFYAEQYSRIKKDLGAEIIKVKLFMYLSVDTYFRTGRNELIRGATSMRTVESLLFCWYPFLI